MGTSKNMVIVELCLTNSSYLYNCGALHIRAYCGHIEDERQTLSYLVLKIWTIFNKTMQMTSNDAHADVYISVFYDCYIYQKRELLLVTHSWQSRASV